jgi:hypothetical protein
MAELARLGARSLPVVSRGERFTFALVLDDVADFLGIDGEAGPTLSAAELLAKLDLVLGALQRLIRQIPDDRLGETLPNITRTYRELGHHIVRIVEVFLEAAEGAELSYEALTAPPPTRLRCGADIADYGHEVARRLDRWAAAIADAAWQSEVRTYYGPQTLHQALERTTWHSAQHVRQVTMVLAGLGVAPDRPLTAADLAGLPLPEKVWDDQ